MATDPIDAKQGGSSWINITVAGTTAGMVAAALTYAVTNRASSAAATTTGMALETIGELAGYGATALFGNVAGLTVRVVSKGIARTSEETVRTGGTMTAAAAAALAGATTALSVTIGTRVVEYSLEYGGKISKDLAVKFSEAYLMYKAKNSAFVDTGDLTELEDSEWVVLSK